MIGRGYKRILIANNMINAHNIDSYILISRFPYHDASKDKTLMLIDEVTKSNICFPGTNISNTDWDIAHTKPKKYFTYIKSSWEEHLGTVYGSFGYKDFLIDSFWFQQYNTGDTHPWHGHGKCNLSSIYYLELPNSTETEFIDPISRKIFKFEVKEGDVMTFPSLFIHRSPVNRTKQRKTIIAVNSSVNNVLLDIEAI